MKNSNKIAKIIVLAVIVASAQQASAVSCTGTWQSAPASPPNSNCDAPINVGSDTQTKAGSFHVGSQLYVNDATPQPFVIGLMAFGNAIFSNGKIGVGTSTPTNPITIQGVSGGSGYSGSDGKGGIRVDWSTGYGVSLDAWDSSTPRWGITKFSVHSPTVVIQGRYNDNHVIFNASGGNVAIGTTTATAAKLTVDGQIKIAGGTPGAGKVLTSDGAGLATWQTPSSSGGTHGYVSLTSSASSPWTVPAGVYSIEVHVVGGGAAGVQNGGMGGGYATAIRAVTPGQQIAYTIGTGGTAVCDAAASGSETRFDTGNVTTGGVIIAYGGNGDSSLGNLTYPVTAATAAGWSGGDWGAYGHSWLDTGAIIQSQNGDKVPGYSSGFPYSRGGGATTNTPQSGTGMLPTFGGGGNGDRDPGGGSCGGNGANGVIIIKY